MRVMRLIRVMRLARLTHATRVMARGAHDGRAANSARPRCAGTRTRVR